LGAAAKAIYDIGALSGFLLLQIYGIGPHSNSRLSIFYIFLPLHKWHYMYKKNDLPNFKKFSFDF